MYILYVACKLYKRLTAFNVLHDKIPFLKYYHKFPQVGTCDQCQPNNKKLKKASGSLHPIPVPSKLWCQVGMDLIGPLPKTSRGNKYIVTLTD